MDEVIEAEGERHAENHTLDLNNAEDCRKIKGQWRVGHGPCARSA